MPHESGMWIAHDQGCSAMGPLPYHVVAPPGAAKLNVCCVTFPATMFEAGHVARGDFIDVVGKVVKYNASRLHVWGPTPRGYSRIVITCYDGVLPLPRSSWPSRGIWQTFAKHGFNFVDRADVVKDEEVCPSLSETDLGYSGEACPPLSGIDPLEDLLGDHGEAWPPLSEIDPLEDILGKTGVQEKLEDISGEAGSQEGSDSSSSSGSDSSSSSSSSEDPEESSESSSS